MWPFVYWSYSEVFTVARLLEGLMEPSRSCCCLFALLGELKSGSEGACLPPAGDWGLTGANPVRG